MLKTDGHYAGDLVCLDFKSDSLQHFLEQVVQLVNQHSQRINALEIDKITTEEVRKGNLSLVTAAKLNPSLAKEIPVQNPGNLDTFNDSVAGLAGNLGNHSNGTHLCI